MDVSCCCHYVILLCHVTLLLGVTSSPANGSEHESEEIIVHTANGQLRGLQVTLNYDLGRGNNDDEWHGLDLVGMFHACINKLFSQQSRLVSLDSSSVFHTPFHQLVTEDLLYVCTIKILIYFNNFITIIISIYMLIDYPAASAHGSVVGGEGRAGIWKRVSASVQLSPFVHHTVSEWRLSLSQHLLPSHCMYHTMSIYNCKSPEYAGLLRA